MPKLRRSNRARTARITWQAGANTVRVVPAPGKKAKKPQPETSKLKPTIKANATIVDHGKEETGCPSSPSQYIVETAELAISDCDHHAMMLVVKLKELFSAHVLAHPECSTQYAVQAAQYIRNKFAFYGIKTPERRSLQKQFLATHKDALKERSTLMSFVNLLWAEDEREMQYFGQELVRQFRSEVLGSSEGEFNEAIAFAESLITHKSWWDTVDMLSYPVVGYFVGERKPLGVSLMKKWINADDLWLRRVAILHQLCMKSKTDEQLLFSFCLARSHETDFFIRKAIGWALRD